LRRIEAATIPALPSRIACPFSFTHRSAAGSPSSKKLHAEAHRYSIT